ncbi:glycosyltransferase family 39 protein [Indiicoccus explosivorum]|uniref:glycosyltransferase family 39 protein n=1 Tax=Indiicoccus explosivorum TaxID=1917864 RepID=UPI000B44C56C|nr:glycosyltransferase family 39 protein [Indiicoccus explosivorum]
MEKVRSKVNGWLLAPLLIGLVIRLALLAEYGLGLSLNSDDVGYIRSAIHLLEHGELTYFDPTELTVHIMPGIAVLIAGVFLFFGTGDLGLYAVKIVMILFGLLSIAGIYKLGERLLSRMAGGIGALITALYLPLVITDNLVLTEAPFTAALIWFIYFAVRLADSHRNADFYWVIGLYLFMIMFRPTIALAPFLLLIYFLLKKYPLKTALKQFGIAVILLLVVLGPWWIRNYIVYDEFIPLSGGAGNPMLLGTYQGHGYKYGEPLDVVLERIRSEHPDASRYELNQYQLEAAKERMAVMWAHNKAWFIDTYTRQKFMEQWKTPFYWHEVFGVSREMMKAIYLVLLAAGAFSLLALFFAVRARWRELLFISLFFVYFTVLNNIYFAYNRYNQPLLPLLFLAIGGFVYYVLYGRKTRVQRE